MCAVATAWPAARATSRAAASDALLAAACAAKAASRASSTEASPRDHARAVSIARRGRSSSGYLAVNNERTCSAQSAAQLASRWWWASSSRPPRWTATKRGSLRPAYSTILAATPPVLPNVGGITCSRAAAVWWMPLLCDSQGLDALDFRLDSLSRIPKVDGALRVEPELRRIAEQPRQAQGHRRTDRPPTAQQLVDRLAGDAQSLG